MNHPYQYSSRLVLGTAQLGMNYGIANTNGQPDYPTARDIVHECWENGICEFDTAQAYGHSERILGKVLNELGISAKANIVTKLDPAIDHSDRVALNDALFSSLDNLGVKSLQGLMLHNEDLLDLWEKGLGRTLLDMVDSGLVKRLGVTVYSPEKAVQALKTEDISMVQIPTNMFDRRFEKSGVFDLAAEKQKTVYVRSVFLQGLLLMSPNSLPAHMQFAAPVLNRLGDFSRHVGKSIHELCIGYIKHLFTVSRPVLGAETVSQVKENLKLWGTVWPGRLVRKIQREFGDIDEVILNPSLWPKRTA